MIRHAMLAALLLAASSTLSWSAAPDDGDTTRGDQMIARYFAEETAKLAERCMADVKTLDDWTSRREELRRRLLEMLGLDPLPEKTDLKAVVMGSVDHEQFTVEKLNFQSRPGLYVTANLYLPKNLEEPAPAILYVCGHGRVKEDGISYGNKVNYQHHPAWFARHGYVAMAIDTLQLGEIEGIHHGTYREKMWWWNCRGYTPAGVEAWNCVRALDYLQTRKEVDPERIGVTGRSGGGAYSWWIAAIDERIKAAVPVAGITDLENHVVDGCVEGHCDCMYMVNTYRWDYPLVAALVAPRPLLISNSDKDSIFPLDGVVRLHSQVRRIYQLYGAEDRLGLQITEGPHKDTQELRIPAFHWFNRFLKGEDPLIAEPAVKFFTPQQLKVFDKLPDDERNTAIHETFTALAPAAAVPQSSGDTEAWTTQRNAWLNALKQKCFGGWPDDPGPMDVEKVFSADNQGVRLTAYEFTSQSAIRLPLYVVSRAADEAPELIVLNAADEDGWSEMLATLSAGFADHLGGQNAGEADEESFRQLAGMLASHNWAQAYVPPRGIGPTAWDGSQRNQTQIRRRFMLLGQTLDGMRVWDVHRTALAVREIESLAKVPLWMQGERTMAGVALYASLFTSDVKRLDLWQLPHTHRDGPILLNVLRFLDVPQAVAMAAERSQVRIYQEGSDGWEYPQEVSNNLGWDSKQLQIREVPGAAAR